MTLDIGKVIVGAFLVPWSQRREFARAQALADRSAIQNAQAPKQTGWLKWGFWVFLFVLLLVFIIPNFWR